MTKLQDIFQSHFGDSSDAFFVRAPGRVNLIGEHVDYNDGFVLPIATPMCVQLLVRPRKDRTVKLFAHNFDDEREFSLDHLEKQDNWIDYVQGVARELGGACVPLHGFEGVAISDVPTASGLSSSAAIEIAAALAFTNLAQQPMAASDLALLCQRAENKFIGVNCGIMDQMAVAACHENHALLLDCRSLETTQVPLRLDEYSFVVTDSGAPRELASSAYNERRTECEEGLAVLQKFLPHVESLRDVEPHEFSRLENELPNPIQARVRHVVFEIARTQQACEYLRDNDLKKFGECMNASHDSLRDDYEVSSRELDWLVNWSREQKGVLGSRLTGAGFGGCTVTLIRNDCVDDYISRLPTEYSAATGRTARCWVCVASAGASVVAG